MLLLRVRAMKKGAVEIQTIVLAVLLLFAMVLLILWFQSNFRAVTNPTSQIARNVSGTGPSVINTINTWNMTG